MRKQCPGSSVSDDSQLLLPQALFKPPLRPGTLPRHVGLQRRQNRATGQAARNEARCSGVSEIIKYLVDVNPLLPPGPFQRTQQVASQRVESAGHVALQPAEAALQLLHELGDECHAGFSAPLSLSVQSARQVRKIALNTLLAILEST